MNERVKQHRKEDPCQSWRNTLKYHANPAEGGIRIGAGMDPTANEFSFGISKHCGRLEVGSHFGAD